MPQSNTKKLNNFQLIRELPKRSALAFSATLLERMFINYQLFSELNQFGDALVARNVLNLLWEYAKTPKVKINSAAQSEKIEEITPDIINFDNFGVYPALDFCMALQAALQLISDEEENAAVMIAKLSQGGTEAYIAEIEEAELTGRLLKEHELMQFEIGVQEYILDICSQRQIDFGELSEFIKDDLLSNLGLSKSQ